METSSRSKSKMLSFLVVYVAIGVSHVGAQTQAGSKAFTRNVKGIQDYDQTAIVRAGSSGNRAYMPYLRSIVTSTSGYRSPAEEEAVIALVKLGDKEKSRELECNLLTNDPGEWEYLAETMLPKIKGWFAIRAYYYMLGHNEEYEQNLKQQEYQSDSVFVSPIIKAVWYLPRIVPRSPLPAVQSIYDRRVPELAQSWKSWILRHRAQLEQLRPVGQKGLAVSSAGCPTAKP